ncbi:hypothetical protein [Maritalea sp.]|uniref:hypothetical protein n=1 Tax=Maritalea sp. TaxID=2003361 RepID=UPI003F4AC683
MSKCKPGQVVRETGYRSEGRFALVADVPNSEKRALVFFEIDGPTYTIFEMDPSYMILAYGGTPIWEIDQFGSFETTPDKLYNANGCLVRDEGGYCMNVRNENTGYHRRPSRSFNLDVGTLEEFVEKFKNIAVFGTWRLFLHDEDLPFEDRIKIAEFSWIDPIGTPS